MTQNHLKKLTHTFIYCWSRIYDCSFNVIFNKRKEPILIRLRLNPVNKHILLFSFLFSFGIIILSDEFDRIVQIFFPTPDYIINMDNLLKPESPLALFLLFIAVSLLAPVGEELLFRGFFQQFLENFIGKILLKQFYSLLYFLQ